MNNRIPQHLDEPERYFVFTADELIVTVVPLVILTLVTNFVVGLVVAGGLFQALRKMKKGGNLNRILWVGYWMLPSDSLSLKHTPPSYARMWVG